MAPPAHTLAARLLPEGSPLHLVGLEETTPALIVMVASTQPNACCPACGIASGRVHSRYTRMVADLPWGGRPVRFRLQVRRFRCPVPACPRRIFAERLPGVVARSARRTARLSAIVQVLGVAVGGRPGARLARRLGLPASATSLVRLARQVVPPPTGSPRAIGVDEFAFRRGRRYGTVIVDLERRRPIDLLPEHSAARLSDWLRRHPGVEVVARDRATLYPEAIAQGAPQAVQVADRYHLAANLGTAVQGCLERHSAALRAAAALAGPVPAPAGEDPLPPVLDEAPIPGHVVGPLPLRQQLFEEAKRLHAAGRSLHQISRELRINRRTATRYVAAAELPRRVLPQATSTLLPYLAQVRAHWAAGARSGPRLLAALRADGYQGSLASIYRFLRHYRPGDGRRVRRVAAVPGVRVRSPRQAMWLLVRPTEALDADDAAYRAALCQCPTLATLTSLAQRFLALLRERQVEALDPWLADAERSGIKELAGFARSLRRDYAAVAAALTTPWSNGPTEGTVNKVKLVKRLMFGRANFDLLRIRVLCRDGP
jgi:transposase